MKTQLLEISQLIEIEEFKQYYSRQSITELSHSIETEGGLKVPIIVSEKLEIIDGYRRVEALSQLGHQHVNVVIVDVEPTIYERIVRNMYRTKTIDDQVKEVKAIYDKYPKKMGKKNADGEVYNRSVKIAAALNNKYANKETISKLEFIINNDLEVNSLTKGIIKDNWKVDPCYELLTKWKEIDETNGYGYVDKVTKGELTPSEAIKFIDERLNLEQDNSTFIIPDKCHSYNQDCREINNLGDFEKSVQLLFSSVYYWKQRFYEVGEKVQPGHESTKEEYLENVSKLLIPACNTLKESAVVAINIADSFVDGIPQRIPYLFIEYVEKNTSLKFIGEIIWSKKNPRGNGASEDKIRPKNKIEYIMTFALNPKKVKYNKLKYKFNDSAPKITQGYKDVNKNGVRSKKRKSLSTGYRSIKNHIEEQEIENIITTSVGENHDVRRIIKEGHPAIMSPMLPISIIQMYTDEGDLVYDFMSGSNVVGRASQLLNRRTLSTEISKKYFNVGCKMLENAVEEFDRESLNAINEISYSRNQLLIAA